MESLLWLSLARDHVDLVRRHSAQRRVRTDHIFTFHYSHECQFDNVCRQFITTTISGRALTALSAGRGMRKRVPSEDTPNDAAGWPARGEKPDSNSRSVNCDTRLMRPIVFPTRLVGTTPPRCSTRVPERRPARRCAGGVRCGDAARRTRLSRERGCAG